MRDSASDGALSNIMLASGNLGLSLYYIGTRVISDVGYYSYTIQQVDQRINAVQNIKASTGRLGYGVSDTQSCTCAGVQGTAITSCPYW